MDSMDFPQFKNTDRNCEFDFEEEEEEEGISIISSERFHEKLKQDFSVDITEQFADNKNVTYS